MKKPSKMLMSLYELGLIKKIEVERVMTSCDTCSDYTIFTDYNGNKVRFKQGMSFAGKEDPWYYLIPFEPNRSHLTHLKGEYKDQVNAYKSFLLDNEKDLVEFERLKRKFTT